MSLKNFVFFCLKIFFTFTNSVDPDEMQQYAAFHLGLHCLQKYLYRGFPEYKWLKFIFALAISADPDEMWHSHLGLQ